VASIRINRSAIRLEEKLQRGNADERHGRILPRLARSLGGRGPSCVRRQSKQRLALFVRARVRGGILKIRIMFSFLNS
jgi:hypothetical protein